MHGMVNLVVWVGGWDSWDPLMKKFLLRGHPDSNPKPSINPKHQFCHYLSVEAVNKYIHTRTYIYINKYT